MQENAKNMQEFARKCMEYERIYKEYSRIFGPCFFKGMHGKCKEVQENARKWKKYKKMQEHARNMQGLARKCRNMQGICKDLQERIYRNICTMHFYFSSVCTENAKKCKKCMEMQGNARKY